MLPRALWSALALALLPFTAALSWRPAISSPTLETSTVAEAQHALEVSLGGAAAEAKDGVQRDASAAIVRAFCGRDHASGSDGGSSGAALDEPSAAEGAAAAAKEAKARKAEEKATRRLELSRLQLVAFLHQTFREGTSLQICLQE